MSVQLNESFAVDAPPDDVWRFLLDPAQVAACLPGAQLTEDLGEGVYRGNVKVKVGPITASYTGTARLTTVDEPARRMQLVAEGLDSSGGTARMTMDGRVAARDGGGAEVTVSARIDIAGRVMQFGRGMVESVSRQMFRQFATAVRSTLAGDFVELEVTLESPADTPRTETGEAMRITRSYRAPAQRQNLGLFRLLWSTVVARLARLFGSRGRA
jgi:carbon monoxide dehydrogenase subunit G